LDLVQKVGFGYPRPGQSLTLLAVESGAITSIAISADHLTVAGGHANGSIFTWETARAARPFLHIPSLDPSQVARRTADGHIPNVPIRHLGFLGTRHTALVSADDRGMAFSHLATRGLGAVGRTVKTTRILGRYPNDVSTSGKPRKPSTVLAFASLPLGNVERGTDTLGLTAMLTPYLFIGDCFNNPGCSDSA
jgi:vacuolar protein sorting-associated protein 8